jgi:serine protease AprX
MAMSKPSAAFANRRMPHALRLALPSAVLLFASVTTAAAQGRAHLSNDLQRHLDAGDGSAASVIVSGTQEQVAALASRHGLRIARALASGAVFEVPANKLDELASDADVPHLSGDLPTHGAMAVTDTAIGADQAWQGALASGSDGANSRQANGAGVTGKGIGVAILDSGVALVPELRGQVSVRIDMLDRRGDGNDVWGHGTHLAGIIAGAGAVEANARGVAPGAHIVSVKVLGTDGAGRISDLIEGIDWVIANRKRYQIDVINLSLGAAVEQSWRDDPVCQAIERAWRVNIVTVAAAGNFGKDANGNEVLGGVTSPGNCPYAITAGAVNTKGTPFRSDDVITTYSSRGPTLIDGLLKPDLLAPGNKVRSLLAPNAVIARQYPEKVVGAGADARLELSARACRRRWLRAQRRCCSRRRRRIPNRFARCFSSERNGCRSSASCSRGQAASTCSRRWRLQPLGMRMWRPRSLVNQSRQVARHLRRRQSKMII